MRLAILGGSFNPIHMGHLFLADVVLSTLRYDRVVMVPAYRSPFKLAAAGMEGSARDRLEMIAASIAADPRLTVDDCEIRREGVSYTVESMADIIRRYSPGEKPGLIIGDDLAEEFPQWLDSDKILEMADVIIARRVHSGRLIVPYPNVQIANDAMDISSKLVRERIAEDGAWHYLVPPAARAIIEDRGLYGAVRRGEARQDAAQEQRSSESPDKSLVLRVEEAVRENLSLERFLHSRSTALFAWDMCSRLQKSNPSLDPELGYLAGMAHDLGKQLSDKVQIKLAKTYGKRISRLEKQKPSLLHGRASAVLLMERFGVYNKDVLEAVAMHTQAGVDMCPLAKVVYVADKMEVSRERADPAVRKLALTGDNLDEIFVAVLDMTVSSLRSRKLKLSAETLKLLQEMRTMQ